MAATRRLLVEVCNATNLMPKDGEGSASAYCLVEYDGQIRRTEPKAKDLNPAWNAVVEFTVSSPLEEGMIEINVLCDKKAGGKQRPQFLGRVRIPGRTVVKRGEEAIVYHSLTKRSFFSHVRGELGVRAWWTDEPDPPPPPTPAEDEKPAEGSGGAEGEKPADEGGGEPKLVDGGDGGGGEEKKDGSDGGGAEDPEKKDSGGGGAEEKKAENGGGGDGKSEEGGAAKQETAATKIDVVVAPKPRPPTMVPPTEYVLKESRPASSIGREKVVTFDLVEKMQYLFVRVVKARGLAAPPEGDGGGGRFVKIVLGSHAARTRPASRSQSPEWNEIFAFGKERMGGPAVEVTIWEDGGGGGDGLLGGAMFDFSEIPTRVPPDSPLAPQWYRLESRGDSRDGKVTGDIMLAVWLGTQADEAFTEAWQSDSGGYAHTRSKVYLSPKLWYLRVNVIEAQEVATATATAVEVTVRAQLGFQVQRTRRSRSVGVLPGGQGGNPFWNEDLVFVAAEPFEEDLLLQVEDRVVGADKVPVLGYVRIPLPTVDRRVDHRQVVSRWYNLDKLGGGDGEPGFHGRLHLRVCFDGGYHVMDEPVNQLSCTKPTAKQLWRPGIGVLELGIIRGKDVLPMKSKEGRGTTDAYVVAKYGAKWVRTRTVVDCLNPRWNEQYRWDVHDPCTVLTVAVFDNCHLGGDGDATVRDSRVGKVRIRLSTLESDRVYTNRYPLLSLYQSGVKKLGEIELAVRYSAISVVETVNQYFQPLLPRMHYLHPLGVTQAEVLRISAMRIVAIRLARSEPPLRQEVVQYVLDSDVNAWSLRRSKVNYYRLMNVLSGPMAVVRWLNGVCKWKSPITTVLVHVLFLILVMYPELILPTLFLYMFIIGLWQYRRRPRAPPSMDPRLSQAETVEPDEMDEEFDSIPSSKDPSVVRARYDRVRIVAARIQNVVGDLATQGERCGSLLGWRDPRATAIFLTFSFLVAVLLYVLPFKVVVVLAGLYGMRHPRFRDPMPPAPLNFFRRLPSLADRIL